MARAKTAKASPAGAALETVADPSELSPAAREALGLDGPGGSLVVERSIAAPDSAFRFEAWPTEFRIVTQWFGARPEFYGKFKLPGHEGIDFVAPMGTKIFAAAPGTIKRVQATDDGGVYGIQVRIQHVDGYETIYAHLKEAQVKLGQAVAAGDVLGLADSTGNSTGSHLHLTLKRAGFTLGKYPNNIADPTAFVKALLEQGKDGAAYVKDIIPDGTSFQAGQVFEQRWTFKNSGTTTWGEGYVLAHLSGDALGAAETMPVPPTKPGGLAEVAVSFQAPANPGRYRSVWQMQAPPRNGAAPARFGERVWVDIGVPAVAVAQPKDFFESLEATSAPAAMLAVDTLAELIGALSGMGAEELQLVLARLPQMAALAVILARHAAQLAAGPGDADLTARTLDQIFALTQR